MRWIKANGQVLKLILKEPVYKAEPDGRPGDGQCGGLCPCFDSPEGEKKIVTHSPPSLYLIEDDPGERSPIDTFSELYKASVPRMLKKLRRQFKREGRTNMRSQLQDFWRVLPAPWLQPCCNPPLCSCDHYKNPQEEPRKVMDLLMDVVGKVIRGRSKDERPDNEFSDDYEEEGEEEELLDD